MNVVSKARVRGSPRPISKQRLRLWLRLLRSSRAIEAQLREQLRTRILDIRCRNSTLWLRWPAVTRV